MSAETMILLSALLSIPMVLATAQKSSPSSSHDRLYNGFVSEVRGEHITYRSSHPYATDALLTRCTDGKQVIEWKTAAMPREETSAYVTFGWLAGHSSGTSTADATFRLAINGTEWFRFTTVKGRRVRRWAVPGKDGARLSFEAKLEDSAHDLFGYMFLKVPVRDFPEGQPLTVSLVGDSAGRKDWYMTFTYPLRDSVSIQPQPALVRSGGGQRQLIDVLMEYSQRSGAVEIAMPGQSPVRTNLALGINRVECTIPAVKEQQQVGVTIAISGLPVKTVTVTVAPVTFREFWLLPHSHNDIGYSDLQADVAKKQLKNLRDAMKLCKKTASYPNGARFKWNSEILWAVDSFLTTCTGKERNEFIALVKEGGIDLNGLYLNELTGLCRPEELMRLTDFARHLRKTYGLEINNAMITDIPGYTWATAPALVQGGIKYFSSGPNYVPTLPDEGDRVGHFNRAWGDKPFYWISPSGRERLLVWVARKGYSWFHAWIAGQAGPTTAPHLFDYLRELDGNGYPYDMVQLRYTIVADNGPTDPNLPDFVKSWNERYASPRLVIATAREMFQEFERRWGNKIPSYAGDMTPYWEDGALSTLRELGIVRQASEKLVQAEALETFDGARQVSRATFDDAWKDVLLFDEHTWGAYNSISEPESPFAVSQWDVKQRYALDAGERSERLLLTALPSASGANAIDVINTTSWSRTDLVVLPPEIQRAGDQVVDAVGTTVPSQRLSDGALAFMAERVPPLGGRRYFIRPGPAAGAGKVAVHGTGLENGLISVKIDPATGALRSLTTPGGEEFVDTSALRGLNQYCYVPGRDPGLVKTNRVKEIVVRESGPLIGTVRIVSEAPGCKELVQDVSLIDGLAKLQIRNTIDKNKVREKESVHFAFPLRVPGGEFHLDGGWGVTRPGIDQLPGSCMDYLCTGRWADVSNNERGVTWTTVESPLIEIGRITDERPGPGGYRVWRDSIAPGTLFYSYVMNNYWHTNYAAFQEGPVPVSYALFPHEAFDAALAYRRGIEQSQPLLVRRVNQDAPNPASLFFLSTPDIVATSVMPSKDGRAVMIRLFNPSLKDLKFTVSWTRFKPKKISISSPTEEEGAPAGDSFSLPSFGIITLRCQR